MSKVIKESNVFQALMLHSLLLVNLRFWFPKEEVGVGRRLCP